MYQIVQIDKTIKANLIVYYGVVPPARYTHQPPLWGRQPWLPTTTWEGQAKAWQSWPSQALSCHPAAWGVGPGQGHRWPKFLPSADGRGWAEADLTLSLKREGLQRASPLPPNTPLHHEGGRSCDLQSPFCHLLQPQLSPTPLP